MKKIKPPLFPARGEVYQAVMHNEIDHREVLLRLMRQAEGRVTKSELLKTAAAFYRNDRYVSSWYINQVMLLNEAFEVLCASGTLIFVRGKSVTLKEDY